MALTKEEFKGFMKVHMTFGIMLYFIMICEISIMSTEFQDLYTDGGLALLIIIILFIIGMLIYAAYTMAKKQIKKLKTTLKLLGFGFLLLALPILIGIL